MKILFLVISLCISQFALAMGDPMFLPASHPENPYWNSMEETTATLNAIEPTEKQEQRHEDDPYEQIEKSREINLRREHERNNSQQAQRRTP